MDDCRYFEERISASLDGELNETEEAALARHLQDCERCRAYRDALRAVSVTSRDTLPPPPPDLTKSIMAAVRKAPAPGKKARILPFPRRVQGLAAAAAVVVLLAGWTGLRLLSPKGASGSTAAQAPQEEMMRIAAAPAAAPAAGTEDPEEQSADNGAMMTFDAVATEEAAREAAPLPFTLRSADGSERSGPDCSALWALAEPADEPLPERGPDYILQDAAGAVLWQLWEEGDSILLREKEDGPLCRMDVGVFWDALGELS